MLVDGILGNINASGDAGVRGVYYDVKSCCEGLKECVPDVLLLDLNLPDGNGINLCKEFKKLYPEMKIIILTMYDDYDIVMRCLKNGANGYLLKDEKIENIIVAIVKVYLGGTYISAKIQAMLDKNRRREMIVLTPQEEKALGYICDGMTDPQIADKMFICKETAKGYGKILKYKFDVKNRSALVRAAVAKKFV